MVDRQPTHAGRVHLEPVSGQQNTFDMTMADGATEQGTPLNKATFLKDATAALYGLPNTAVPDDVFAWLGKYNTYAWERSKEQYVTKYRLIPEVYSNSSIKFLASGTIYWSDGVVCDEDTGVVSLVNPQIDTTHFMWNSMRYYQSDTSIIDPSSNQPITTPIQCNGYSNYSDGGSYYIFNLGSGSSHYIYYQSSEAFQSPTTVVDFVFSQNRSAYPDDGDVGEYHFRFSGIPFDNAASVPTKIETGSYVGTGTYGASNPNSLTFGFVPKLLIVSLAYKNTSTPRETQIGGYAFSVLYDAVVEKSGDTTYPAKIIGTASGASFVLSCSLSNNKKTISWYSTESAMKQLNPTNGTTYYIAIG